MRHNPFNPAPAMNEIPASNNTNTGDTGEARACIDRFSTAFNAGDLAGMDAELNFPHTLFYGTHRLEWATPGQLPIDFFNTLRATGWARTHTESITPVLRSTDKVHFLVHYTRRTAEGEVLDRYHNLWIVTRSAGHWGIALRSY